MVLYLIVKKKEKGIGDRENEKLETEKGVGKRGIEKRTGKMEKEKGKEKR